MGMFDSLYGQQYSDLTTPEDQSAAKRKAMMAITAQLLQAGGPSRLPISTGQAIGSALQAGGQAQDESYQGALRAALLRKQLQGVPRDPEDLVQVMTPSGPIWQKKSAAVGMPAYNNQPGGKGLPGLNDVDTGKFTPESLYDYEKSINPATGRGDYRLLKERNTPVNPVVVNTPAGVSVVQPTRGGGISGKTDVVTAPQLRGAEADQAMTKDLALEQAKRQASFPADMAKIDDEIARTNRLIKEFKSGKYQTGPIAGMMPNLRTSAQDLNREIGKDTLSAISSATFGALSEGERKFLRDLGVSDSTSEESNINALSLRLEGLQRAKDRLQGRAPLIGSGSTGSWSITEVK